MGKLRTRRRGSGWLRAVLIGGALLLIPVAVGVYLYTQRRQQPQEVDPTLGPTPPSQDPSGPTPASAAEPSTPPPTPVDPGAPARLDPPFPDPAELVPAGDPGWVVPADFRGVMVEALRRLDIDEEPPWLADRLKAVKSLGIESEHGLERRRSIRVHTQMGVHYRAGELEGDGQVVNLGLGGLHLYLDYGPPVGSRIQLLEPGNFDGIHCVVQWVRRLPNSSRRLVGLRYDEKPEALARSRLAQLLAELGFLETVLYRRRRISRVSAELQVQVSDQREPVAGTVLNIGVGGVLVSCEAELSEGTALCVRVGPLQRLTPLTVNAEVRYRRAAPEGWLYGLRFLHLNPDQVKLLGKYVLELLKS